MEPGPIEEALKRQWDDTELRERDSKAKQRQEKPGRHDRGSGAQSPHESRDEESSDIGDPDGAAHSEDEEELDKLELDVLHAGYSDDEDRDEAEETMAMFRKARTDFKKSRRTLTQAKGLMKNIRRERRLLPRRRQDKPAAHAVEATPQGHGARQKRTPTPGRGKLRQRLPLVEE